MTAAFVDVGLDVSAMTARLAMSDRLRRREFRLIPVDAPVTGVQGREPGDSTTPAALEDLISSIETIGLLTPLLLEDVDGRLLVVAGERRLRAMRWGARHRPDNPNFAQAPAMVCPGPLTEEERRTWQLIENLARTDLQPGELAAALMFERCAVLAALIEDAGRLIPAGVVEAEDPIRRWELLDRYRREEGLHSVGAPWEMVIQRLGLQLSADRAKQLVRAFKVLPSELSSEMDEEGVRLNARLEYLRLHQGGREDAAAGIWAALRERGQAGLLTSAARLVGDGFDVDDAVEEAESRRQLADEARSVALSADAEADGEYDDAEEPEPTLVPGEVVRAVFAGLDELLERLRAGEVLGGYMTGSLKLRIDQVEGALGLCQR